MENTNNDDDKIGDVVEGNTQKLNIGGADYGMDDLVPLKIASKITGCGKTQFYKLVKRYKINSYKIPGSDIRSSTRYRVGDVWNVVQGWRA